jgi:citrate lyase subunit beta / citryl-CoA lyase
MALARSHLYVPGDRAEMVKKAGLRGADALIIDLEDAVALSHKDNARSIVAAALASGIEGAGEIWIRVNSPSVRDGAETLADLEVAVTEGVAGVLVAKVDTPDEIATVVAEIERLEHARSLPGTLMLGAMVESATGLAACEAIARSRRVARFQAGEADLAASLGIEVADDELEMLPIRHRIVAAAAAAGIDPPTGPVSIDIANLDRLAVSTLRLRRLGFAGRAVIHPAQIPIVHAAFTPSPEALARARHLVATFEAAVTDGTGVIVDAEGRMIDEAVVLSARRVLAIGRQRGRP